MKQWLLIASAALLAVACGGNKISQEKEEEKEQEKDKPVAVSQVTVSPTSADLNTGETLQLQATVLPENATDKTVTWSTSDPAVASVSASGLVSALKAGSADIMALCSGISATCKVTVTVPFIAVTGISLAPLNLTLNVGESQTLTATVQPENASDKTVTWVSANPAIATVEGGSVKAVACGKTTITAQAGEKTADCKVTVIDTVDGGNEGTGNENWN